MMYIAIFVFVVIFLGASFLAYQKRVRESSIRSLVKSQAITYSMSVEVHQFDAGWRDQHNTRGPMALVVRGNYIEISCPIALMRVISGMEFYFLSSDVQIEISQSRWGREVIRLTGDSAGRVIRLTIANRNYLPEIWNALVRSGAIPLALPPGS